MGWREREKRLRSYLLVLLNFSFFTYLFYFQISSVCYIVVYADLHLHTCTYICRIIHNDTTTKTDVWRKTQEDFFAKIYTSHYNAKVRKGCSRVVCERELETEHKLQYFDPTVMTVTLCLSCSLRLPNRGPRLPDAGFLHCIFASSLDPKLHRGFRGPPGSGVAFPTTLE